LTQCQKPIRHECTFIPFFNDTLTTNSSQKDIYVSCPTFVLASESLPAVTVVLSSNSPQPVQYSLCKTRMQVDFGPIAGNQVWNALKTTSLDGFKERETKCLEFLLLTTLQSIAAWLEAFWKAILRLMFRMQRMSRTLWRRSPAAFLRPPDARVRRASSGQRNQ